MYAASRKLLFVDRLLTRKSFFISVNEVQLLSSFILSMAAFLTVHAGSWGGLQENLLTFQFLTIHVLLLPRQNKIQLLSRFFCYSKMVCLFGFWAEESFATEFNKSES